MLKIKERMKTLGNQLDLKKTGKFSKFQTPEGDHVSSEKREKMVLKK